jgi:hypothetical protein
MEIYLILEAVEGEAGGDLDYALLIKLYGDVPAARKGRYSPAECTRKMMINGFSKKLHNHIHALALYFMYYNFTRFQNTLKGTPAMAAGITDRLWSMEDIVLAIDARAAELARKRRQFKKREAKIVSTKL